MQSENKTLTQENKSLRKVIDSNQKSINMLVQELANLRTTYLSNLNELNAMKHEYSKILSSISALRIKYQKEMEAHMKRLRNQK